MEDLFLNFDLSNRGVSINGNTLSSLRFTDDVTIIAQDLEELELSLNELSVVSMLLGLEAYVAKTKVLPNKHVTYRPVIIQKSVIEKVQSHL